MIAPGNDFIQILLALAFVIASGYAAGRIHQWYKHGLERDDAFRNGYNEASRSMFDMAMNTRRVSPAAEVPGGTGRHGVINDRQHRSIGLSRRRITAAIEHRPAPRRQTAALSSTRNPVR